MAEGTGSVVGVKIEVLTFSCELLIPPDGIRSSNPAPSFPKRPCSVLQCTSMIRPQCSSYCYWDVLMTSKSECRSLHMSRPWTAAGTIASMQAALGYQQQLTGWLSQRYGQTVLEQLSPDHADPVSDICTPLAWCCHSMHQLCQHAKVLLQGQRLIPSCHTNKSGQNAPVNHFCLLGSQGAMHGAIPRTEEYMKRQGSGHGDPYIVSAAFSLTRTIPRCLMAPVHCRCDIRLRDWVMRSCYSVLARRWTCLDSAVLLRAWLRVQSLPS